MKCMVCETDMGSGRGRCPVCGFPVIYSVEAGKSKHAIEPMAEVYKKKILGSGIIGIKACRYKRTDDGLLWDGETDMELARLADIPVGQPLWVDQKFAGIAKTDMAEIILDLYLESGDNRQDISLTLGNPDVKGCWQLGLMGGPGFRIAVLLGNPEKYVRSGSFSFAKEAKKVWVSQ